MGLIIAVAPGADLAGELQGLLGNFDGNNTNDERGRGSGARIDPRVLGVDNIRSIYAAFVSW